MVWIRLSSLAGGERGLVERRRDERSHKHKPGPPKKSLNNVAAASGVVRGYEGTLLLVAG